MAKKVTGLLAPSISNGGGQLRNRFLKWLPVVCFARSLLNPNDQWVLSASYSTNTSISAFASPLFNKWVWSDFLRNATLRSRQCGIGLQGIDI